MSPRVKDSTRKVISAGESSPPSRFLRTKSSGRIRDIGTQSEAIYQQFLHVPLRETGDAGIPDHRLRSKLRQDLPARAAGRKWHSIMIDNRGSHNIRLPGTAGHRAKDRIAFRANCQTVGGIFDVAA